MPYLNLQQYFPALRAGAAGLPRAEMLALRPRRNPAIVWAMASDTESPGARLTVPRREDKLGQILGRIFQLPTTRTIALDEFGAAVWARCDGTQSVDQLITFTSTAYKLNRRQAEVSVVAFLRMLAQRRLIGLNDAGTDTGKGTAHVQRRERSRTPIKNRSRRRH